ncbi:MAG: threonine ammonia-lyase IlvA [Bacteroidetes bacterium]|nr:threonine ammonia-lyase IlvA [Bacteroidota bacterium]
MSKELQPSVQGVIDAAATLQNVVDLSPLQRSEFLSDLFEAEVYLKREDLQAVRSYKLRGAFNFLSNITDEQKQNGVVCASAGNHAQGFAFSCDKLNIKGTVFMPTTTPKQKVRQVSYIGKESIDIVLHGDTYDDAKEYALAFCEKHHKTFVSPFDHPLIIEGQGTVGKEILDQCGNEPPDFVFAPIGGGGLSAGCCLYIKSKNSNVQIIGAEPKGAPAMYESFRKGSVVRLDKIDNFVDGAAVREVGQYTFEILKRLLDDIILVPEGRICTYILEMYDRAAIVAEPAGVLSIAALVDYKEKIKGKKVVCILSGGNNDISRMPLIKEKSLLFEGLKHYFVITFPQRAGALKEFVNEVLGPTDDITLFEYTKKNTKEAGPALVGIEIGKKEDYQPLLDRMTKYGIDFKILNDDPTLFNFLV